MSGMTNPHDGLTAAVGTSAGSTPACGLARDGFYSSLLFLMKKKTSSSVVTVGRSYRTGNAGRGRVTGAGLSSVEAVQHLHASRGWVLNPRTGLRVAVA